MVAGCSVFWDFGNIPPSQISLHNTKTDLNQWWKLIECKLTCALKGNDDLDKKISLHRIKETKFNQYPDETLIMSMTYLTV